MFVYSTDSRIFTIFYALFGISFVFAIIADAAQTMILKAQAEALEKVDDDVTDYKVLFSNHKSAIHA
jgi:predicted solute-binding protein